MCFVTHFMVYWIMKGSSILHGGKKKRAALSHTKHLCAENMLT